MYLFGKLSMPESTKFDNVCMRNISSGTIATSSYSVWKMSFRTFPVENGSRSKTAIKIDLKFFKRFYCKNIAYIFRINSKMLSMEISYSYTKLLF